jgi:hypothetical protein
MLSTNQARISLFSLVALVALKHEEVNAGVAAVWEVYRTLPLVQHDSFEPLVAVTSFFFWTRMWHFLDVYMPSLRPYK